MNLSLLDRGREPYPDTWELQKDLVKRRADGSTEVDSLILVEHDHVITLGRKTTPENFKPQDIPVFTVERGGDATYHGPGQLVGYPIVRLATPNVQRFVRDLEEVLIQATRSYGIEAVRVEGHPGAWVGGKKVASIGVAVTNWVTFHGFALNVNVDLSYFALIKPCGLDPNKITSMKQVLGKEVPLEDVKAEVVMRFTEVFGYDLRHVTSDRSLSVARLRKD